MADITLFELHVHDGLDFSPSSVIGGGSDDVEEDGVDVDVDAERDDEESSGAGRAVGALVGLVLLAAIGIGVKKLLSDDLDPIEDLEELDEAVEA